MTQTVDIRELLDRYDGFLLDAFGVLIDGSGALPGAAALLHELDRLAKPYLIVTNGSSRTAADQARHYQSVGLPVTPEHVLTSASLLGPCFARHGLSGARVAVLGTEGSRSYVSAAGGEVVDPLGDDFDVLVVANQTDYPFLDSIDQVISTLIARLDRGEPAHLILTNPDLFYPKGGGRFGITAGSIATMIENILQAFFGARPETTFERLGKPFAPMFEAAFRRLGTRNVLMVGDQIATDIIGARGVGIDAALVLTGLARPDQVVFAPAEEPTYLVTSLVLGPS